MRTNSSAEVQNRLAYFSDRRDAIVSTIRDLVEIESPSDNKAGVDQLAEVVAEKFSRLGGEIRFHRANNFGNHLQVNFGGKAAKPVLLLGHYDTVYPMGTLASMPGHRLSARLRIAAKASTSDIAPPTGTAGL